MKKFNPNKNIIITLIIVIIVVTVISLTAAKQDSDEKTNVVQSGINDAVGFIDKIIATPVGWIADGIGSVSDLFDTYNENQRLKESLDSYEEVAQKNQDYEKQILDLQEQLELKNTLSEYEKISANVISRSPDSWQDTLVVDRSYICLLAHHKPCGNTIYVHRTSPDCLLRWPHATTLWHHKLSLVE